MDVLTSLDSYYPEKKGHTPDRKDLEVEYYYQDELVFRVQGFPAPSRGDYVSLMDRENLKVRSVVHHPDRFLVVAFLVDPKHY